ncbi:DUF6516 family protein [Telmatospirillum sp.]|uniref:toxin-antitoxin system TumE family protein n=1 Tax=Telmatospirillum sp. TaxID=2079197 RepID=UPI0028479914|nr:DUF6516 family protein [Telmatospirillum sp.]MDR3435564.1 DUF6516 family protein [Telmatospirillum sp.]
MKAENLFYRRYVFDDDAIVEMTVWRVPEPVPPTTHGFKYSLFYGRRGVRLCGYDNERGKGDHKHTGELEVAYSFTTVQQLIADFLADVRELRRGL